MIQQAVHYLIIEDSHKLISQVGVYVREFYFPCFCNFYCFGQWKGV